MKTIEEYARLGEQHDVMQALELLTKAYVSMCGISLGFRTVVYCAAEAWMERLAWMDLPLSEKARKEPLINLMPYITSEYDPEDYDCYDIAGMDEKELLAACQQIIREKAFDEDTLEVLCWGVLKASEEMSPEMTVLSKEIETTAPDGTCLKGVLMRQSLGATWVEMTSPYEGVNIDKIELVCDARELLIEGYEDYLRLHNKEHEIREIYPKYQDELRKLEKASGYKKFRVFHDVYEDILNDTILSFPEKLFHDWFDLDFDFWY